MKSLERKEKQFNKFWLMVSDAAIILQCRIMHMLMLGGFLQAIQWPSIRASTGRVGLVGQEAALRCGSCARNRQTRIPHVLLRARHGCVGEGGDALQRLVADGAQRHGSQRGWAPI
jgi:hypothetical protein